MGEKRYQVEGRGKAKRLIWRYESEEMEVPNTEMPSLMEIRDAVRTEFPGISATKIRLSGLSTRLGVLVFHTDTSGCI